jgi:PAS domain S-box-containing protein
MPPDEYLDDARSACETRHWLENLEVMTEKQLQVRASEEIYRTLFETTGMPLCMVDDKGVILLVNNYFERVLGYSKKEIEGRMHFTRVVHPEEVDRLQCYFNLRVVSPGDVPDEYETRVIDKTGNIREAIFNVRMIPGSGNRVVSALDITELKDNEREIKRAHTRYKTLFENAPVAICERDFSKVKKIFDSLRKEGVSDFKRYFEDHPEMVNKCIASSRLIEFNRAMAEIHGTSQSDLINSLVQDSTLNKKEFWHLFFDVFTRLAEGETRFAKEYKIRTARGRQKTIAMVMAVAQEFENDMSEVYFCFHDITSLKESEARYRALVDLSGEIGESIIMLTDFNDQEAVIAFTSTQFARLTGYKKHELLGKPFIDLIFPEDKEAVLSRHRRKMKGESMPGLFEIRLLGKKGKIIPAELTSAVTDYQGKSVNVVYLRDVTERKKREQTLIASEQRFKALSNKIIQHQAAERVTLSRELHDQFGQTLVSLRLELLNLQKQYHELSGCSRINQMLGCVDSLVEMTRTLASELRPGMLEKLGLVSTLQWYAEQFEQQTGISCKVFIKAPSLQDIEIQPDTAIVAYRIIQEALANVCKHSQATRVNIVLNVKNRNLVVAVEDNGIGAKLNKQEGQMHLGIMGMQERASIVGGELKIQTHVKRGFKLSAYLPLEKQIRGV